MLHPHRLEWLRRTWAGRLALKYLFGFLWILQLVGFGIAIVVDARNWGYTIPSVIGNIVLGAVLSGILAAMLTGLVFMFLSYIAGVCNGAPFSIGDRVRVLTAEDYAKLGTVVWVAREDNNRYCDLEVRFDGAGNPARGFRNDQIIRLPSETTRT